MSGNWKKGGPSPNPTGKRTGARQKIADLIDEICGEGARDQIEIIALMSKGIMKDPHIPHTFVRVTSDTAFHAALWITEQRHGKAKQSVDVDLSGHIDHTQRHDLSKLAQGELADLERLLEKSDAGEVIEGEIVPSPALTDSQKAPNTPETPVLAPENKVNLGNS